MPISITTPLLSRDVSRWRFWLFEAHSEPVHRRSHCSALSKYGGSRDQHIGSRIYRQRRSGGVDTTINLEIAALLALINHPAYTPYLGQRRVNETLVPEARVDRHDEHLIHVPQNLFERCRRRRRIDGHAGTFPQPLDVLHRAMQVGVPFPVNEKRIGPGFDELV